jgi:hypothetical protein
MKIINVITITAKCRGSMGIAPGKRLFVNNPHIPAQNTTPLAIARNFAPICTSVSNTIKATHYLPIGRQEHEHSQNPWRNLLRRGRKKQIPTPTAKVRAFNVPGLNHKLRTIRASTSHSTPTRLNGQNTRTSNSTRRNTGFSHYKYTLKIGYYRFF